MKNIRITRNPYLLFIPFLLFYLIYIYIVQKDPLWGDEARHVLQVQHLLSGYYAVPGVPAEIRNGPGYPMFMLPFMAFGIPLIFVKLMNGVFLYLSVVFVFKTLIRVTSFKITLLLSLFWACYINSLDFIALMHAETFATFLVSALVLCLVKAFIPDKPKSSKRYLYIAGFIFGYLALTKVIFGYVILCLLLGCFIVWLSKRHILNYQKGLIVVAVAMLTVSPYLAYTYSITGRVFYWATSGGDNMYWMSTPYDKEYGSWMPGTMLGTDSVKKSPAENLKLDLKSREEYIEGTEDSLRAHHEATFEEIYKFKGPQRDDAFKEVVFKNIREHPLKFLQNCISNVGRMLFNYPYSYTIQKPATLARLPFNGTLVLLMLFCLIPTFINWKQIIYPVRFLLFFVALYLGGSIFGSSEVRMFTVAVPAILLWIAFVTKRTIRIKFKFDERTE